MARCGAQLSHHAHAQALIGIRLAAEDGSTAVVSGENACITILGFFPLAGGVMAVAASLTMVSSVVSEKPVQSPP